MHEIPQAIDRATFEQWVTNAFKTSNTPSVRKVAKIGGISKSTLSYQLTTNAIDPRNIIAIARGQSLNPLHQLCTFAGYESLKNKPKPLNVPEVLSLIHNRDIYAEIARRFHLGIEEKKLDPVAKENTWYSWFKTAAPNATYANLKEITGISQSMVTRNHQAANWSIEQLIAISHALNLSPHIALVASGNLTLREAGYSATTKEQALAAATNQELQSRLEKIAPNLAQNLEQHLESEITHAIVEHLA